MAVEVLSNHAERCVFSVPGGCGLVRESYFLFNVLVIVGLGPEMIS